MGSIFEADVCSWSNRLRELTGISMIFVLNVTKSTNLQGIGNLYP